MITSLTVTLVFSSVDSGKVQIYGASKETCKKVIVSPEHRSLVDSNGILMMDYGGNIGIVYNPVMMEDQAIKYYDLYSATGNITAKRYLINSADFLIDHASEKGNYSLWEYSFPWPYYRCLNPPYASALAQAQGMVVLMYAHKLTNDSKYIQAANKSFGAFLTDYNNGGVSVRIDHHSLIFEELAKPAYHRTDILNVHMFATIALQKYYDYTHNPVVGRVIAKGINYLKNYMDCYDTGDWSYFDHFHTYSTNNYHFMHIGLLKTLHNMTSEPLFDHYAKKFTIYALKK